MIEDGKIEWVEHGGSAMPVASEVLVVVRFRHRVGRKPVESRVVRAGKLKWEWTKRKQSGGDILLWRRALPSEEEGLYPPSYLVNVVRTKHSREARIA